MFDIFGNRDYEAFLDKRVTIVATGLINSFDKQYSIEIEGRLIRESRKCLYLENMKTSSVRGMPIENTEGIVSKDKIIDLYLSREKGK